MTDGVHFSQSFQPSTFAEFTGLTQGRVSTDPKEAAALSMGPYGYYIVDQQKTAGNMANAYQQVADGAMGKAVSSAGTGLSTALNNYNAASKLVPGASAYASKVNANADAATRAAMGIGTDISSLRKSAGMVASEAQNLRPYADTISGYGDEFWRQGQSLFDKGGVAIDQGNAILGMNRNVGGVSAEYLKWFDSLDPNRYVSSAASDTQQSFANAIGQMNRSLARVGSSSSGGNSQALKQQYGIALATALASAKTRARQAGLDAQAAGLDRLTSAATAMIGSGNDTTKTGLAYQTQGEGAKAQAANVAQSIASLFAQSGSMYSQAGNLGATQSNALTNAGQQYSLASNVMNQAQSNANSAAGIVASAAGTAANAGANAANYYAQIAQGYGQIAGAYGLFAGAGAGKTYIANETRGI